MTVVIKLNRKWLIIVFTIFLLFMPSCKQNGLDSVPSQPLIDGQHDSNWKDVKTKPILASEDIIFLSIPIDNNSIDIVVDIYSSKLNENEFRCLTCDQEFVNAVTSSPVSFHLPASLSREGRYLALSTTDELNSGWVIDLPNGDIRFLSIPRMSSSGTNYSTAWSPDNKNIAFLWSKDHAPVIVDSKTGEDYYPDFWSELFSNWTPGMAMSRLSWSPDGNQLVFNTMEGLGILSFNERIVSFPLTESNWFTDDEYTIYVGYSQWSPNKDRILLVSNKAGRSIGLTWKDIAGDSLVSGGRDEIIAFELYIINPDGESQTCLTCNPHIPPLIYMHPYWSPEGDQIAYFGINLSEWPEKYDDLYIINSDGSNLRHIARFPAGSVNFQFGGPPRWSKDGKKLVFSVWNESHMVVYTINVDGSDLRLIANDPTSHFIWPEWLR